MYKGGFQMAWTVTLLSVFAMAQATPLLTGVEPTTGRVGDAVTVPGENLGGSSIQEILLCKVSEDPPEDFHPAEILERTEDKIMMKIPQVEPGAYALALKVADIIYISVSVQIAVE